MSSKRKVKGRASPPVQKEVRKRKSQAMCLQRGREKAEPGHMSRKRKEKGKVWPAVQEEAKKKQSLGTCPRKRKRQSLTSCPGRGKGKAELGHLSRKRKWKGRAWSPVQEKVRERKSLATCLGKRK
jgi:hypothetical protein